MPSDRPFPRQPIINGTLEPKRVSLRSSYDPQRGLTITEEWETAGDNLNGLATQCREAGKAYDLTSNGRKSRIVITSSNTEGTGFDDIPIDTWQLLGNEVQNSIKHHPNVRSLGSADFLEVIDAVNQWKDGETPDEFFFTDDGYMGLLFRMLIHEAKTYSLGQYVLKHTTNVSNRWDTNVADQGVEFIYTTSQLVSEISNPGFWTFPCPGRLISKIQSIEVQNDSEDLIWGWKKGPSTEGTSANNRIDISTEYVLAGWSKLTYLPL